MADDNSDDDIEIVSSEDEKVKLIGEILSSDSSRIILKLISNGTEMTANDIAKQTNMSLSLVKHHLKKMKSAGMVKILKTGKSIKGQKMNYYIATKQSFLILPPEKTTHSVFESLKKFSKFAVIGLAGLVSWTLVKPSNTELRIEQISDSDETNYSEFSESLQDKDESWSSASKPEIAPEPQPEPEPTPESSHSGIDEFNLNVDSEVAETGSVTLDRTVYPQPFDFPSSDSTELLLISFLVPTLVIFGGILLERLLSRWYRKKKSKIVHNK